MVERGRSEERSKTGVEAVMADDKEKEKFPVTEVLEEDDEFEVGPSL